MFSTGTYHDASLTLAATGVPQLLLGANAANQAIEIFNVGSSAVGISFTSATPAIGQPGTITLVPGFGYCTPPTFVPSNPIFIVGAAGTPVSCLYR